MPIDDVLKYFPNRTRVSIITHAIHLNLQSYDYNPWTKEEDEYILSHWQTEADMIMCKSLDVHTKLHRLDDWLLACYISIKTDLDMKVFQNFLEVIYNRGKQNQWKIVIINVY